MTPGGRSYIVVEEINHDSSPVEAPAKEEKMSLPFMTYKRGNDGTEPDVLMTTAQIMKQFGVTRDRVSKLARARKWRYTQIGPAKLFYRVDVQEEADRRIEKGLKADRS